MKTLLVYYSYTGNSAQLAGQVAARTGADLCEIEAYYRPSVPRAYTRGAMAARRQQGWPIAPLAKQMENYDRILFMGPIWAGYPAPPLNSAIALLPAGKAVQVMLLAKSGKGRCQEAVSEQIRQRGCTVELFQIIRA
ncbi:MAG: hypothetical protein GXX99_01160 [Clostridiales bacterium]|nr:hypothetical protein [Clostridiales bacterium]